MVDKDSQSSNESNSSISGVDTEISIGENYTLFATKKLGAGAFGEIYQGYSSILKENVAIKLEMVKNLKHPQLIYEYKLYSALKGGIGIPNVYWYGTQGNYNILIMDLLGPSIEDLFNFQKRKFTLKTTLMLGDQMLSRIEYIHSKGYLHRDLKPDNFLMGVGKKKTQVYAIDFGLAKKYKDSKTGLHIPYKEGKSLTGTARYASLSTHLGIEQARRDDIEALIYILIYFLRGDLPWQGLKAKNIKEKYQKIKEKKLNTDLNELCLGMPKELITLLLFSRDIKFEEKPDYNYVRKTIHEMAGNEKIEFDFVFDWMEKRDKKDDNKNFKSSSNNKNESTKVSTQNKKST